MIEKPSAFMTVCLWGVKCVCRCRSHHAGYNKWIIEHENNFKAHPVYKIILR